MEQETVSEKLKCCAWLFWLNLTKTFSSPDIDTLELIMALQQLTLLKH